MFFEYDNMIKLGQMMAQLCSDYWRKSEEQHFEGMSISGDEIIFHLDIWNS